MTEYSIFLDNPVNPLNGASPTAPEPVVETAPDVGTVPGVDDTTAIMGDLPLPRVDAERGVFITSRNEEIQLSDRPVSGLIVERLSMEGKPAIPMVKVNLLGKREELQPNPEHAGYKLLLKDWELESKIRTLKYLFVVGVKGQPPEEFIADHLTYFPSATDQDLKYLWVCSRVPDADIDAFSDAIMGQTLPTTKGTEEAANFTE